MARFLNIFFSLCSVFILWEGTALAQGKYVNLSVQGAYQRTFSDYSLATRTSLGGDIGIPLSEVFEVSVSHNLLFDTTTYTEEYRQRVMERYGTTDLPATLETREQVIDTSVNIGVGYPIGFARPSLFGGKMWRRVCSEDTLEDRGCTPEKSTWNVGAAVSVYVTMRLRLKVSYRVSPSVRTDSKKTYDDQAAVGLTWGI
jgi:hypothetical protein